MKILMRSTVFKTAALAGLFSCVLALGGVFPGVTVSAHADHPITAEELEAEPTEANLKDFVEAAVDRYYLEYLMTKRCDFRKLGLPPEQIELLPLLEPGIELKDLSPESIGALPPEDLKKLVKLFNNPLVKDFLKGKDIWDSCTPLPDTSTFRTEFEKDGGRWKSESGSTYLFVFQYSDEAPEQQLVFHGVNKALENQELKDRLKDASDPPINIPDLVEKAADGLVEDREKGFLCYLWDDPSTDDDNIDNMGDPLKASGDSVKISYVVDPFDYFEVPPPPGPRVIFGSGIYPEGQESCTVDATEPPEPPTTGGGDSGGGSGSGGSSGGGCAIAAGSADTPLGVAFNLLLAASALVLTVSFASRRAGGRNGVRS